MRCNPIPERRNSQYDLMVLKSGGKFLKRCGMKARLKSYQDWRPLSSRGPWGPGAGGRGRRRLVCRRTFWHLWPAFHPPARRLLFPSAKQWESKMLIFNFFKLFFRSRELHQLTLISFNLVSILSLSLVAQSIPFFRAYTASCFKSSLSTGEYY